MLKKKIPNYLTILRGLLTVIIIILFFTPWSLSYVIIFILFLIACLTDWLDGYLARQWQVVSNFGKIFDPLFDKILTISLYFLLNYALGGLFTIIFILLIIRELVVDGLKNYMLSKHEVTPAIKTAKVKTTCQMLMLTCLLAFLVWPKIQLLLIGYFFGLGALIMAYWSGWSYFQKFLKHYKK